MNIEKSLHQLKQIIMADEFSLENFKKVAEEILIWLNENNTDENCRKVDIYFSTQVELGEKAKKMLPEVVQGIIFDLGSSLHDTHSSPDIANNFESTPEQLLERVRSLQSAAK